MTDREKPRPCYRDRDNGVYFTREAHRIDCAEVECRGCTPCPGRHCGAKKSCTWHIAETEITCGRCIATTRRNLRGIVGLSALMLTAAIADGLESEAANLAGPAVDPEAWSWRKAAARQGVAWHVSLVEEDDEHHPLRVLGTWERMIREDYGQPTDTPLTVVGAADYLDRQLHRIAQDDGQDFPLLSAELRKCYQHLEAVLHNDTRPDQGAPCPQCLKAGAVIRLTRHHGHWCTDDDCERIHFADDSGDVWRCPRDVAHWWTQEGYAELLRERRSA